MEDDFLEENTIFEDDEVLDYIIYEKTEKELGKKQSNAGCLSTIFVIFSTFGLFATFFF